MQVKDFEAFVSLEAKLFLVLQTPRSHLKTAYVEKKVVT